MNSGRGAEQRRHPASPRYDSAARTSARRLRVGAAVAVGALVLTGCAVSADAPEASPTPEAKLAEKAEVASKNKGTTSKVGKRAKTDRDAKGEKAKNRSKADRSGKAGGPEAATDGPAGTRGGADNAADSDGTTGSVDWREVTATGDSTGDHGNGPEYADITALTIQDSGDDALLRVTVAGVLPGRLVTGEVQGVGIDFFRSDDQESDYQVFLDGGTHGWRAFLQTPEGFVKFPGTLSVSGRTLTTVVPWASIGGREDASVSAFADWSSGVGRLSADGVPRTELSLG